MRLVRIRVIEASRILFVFAVSVFLIAVIAMGVFLASNRVQAVGAAPVQSGFVRVGTEKVVSVYAAGGNLRRSAARGAGMKIEVLPLPSPTPALRVLIYHTHTHEAYAQTAEDPYLETEQWRTTDRAHSVVRVGDALADSLRDMGVQVVHDTTDHEPPKLGTAYTRSLETLEAHADERFDLAIDLHRDAYDERIQDARAVAVSGVSSAQIMILVGKGEGFSKKPDTARNLAFAKRLTERLNALSPDLCREVLIKTGRYNQHVITPSLLVEVGHNLNTLKEALAAVPTLAQGIFDVLADAP